MYIEHFYSLVNVLFNCFKLCKMIYTSRRLDFIVCEDTIIDFRVPTTKYIFPFTHRVISVVTRHYWNLEFIYYLKFPTGKS